MSIQPDAKYVHPDYSVRKLENDYQMGPEASWTQFEMVPGQSFIFHPISILPLSNRGAMIVLWASQISVTSGLLSVL